MQTTLDYRRENLRKLIEQWGGPLPLSKKLGYANASFLVQMAGPHPTREVSEKTARTIEMKLELPTLWMDEAPPSGKSTKVNKPDASGKKNLHKDYGERVDTTVVAEVIRYVGQTAEDMGVKLTHAKLADVVTLVYSDLRQTGELRVEYVKQLLQLLK